MIIYQITNKINGHFYIGKTTKFIAERFARHLYNSRYGQKTHLYNAIRKYGEDNFVISLVEKVQEDIDEREKYWIEKLSPHYNMTLGGDGGDTSSSPNFIESMKKYHNSKKREDYATYGMLGKSHPNKGKKLQSNCCPVVCDGIRFESVGDAQNHFKGVSVRKRIDNPNYPNWYRLRPKTVRK